MEGGQSLHQLLSKPDTRDGSQAGHPDPQSSLATSLRPSLWAEAQDLAPAASHLGNSVQAQFPPLPQLPG